MESIPKHVLFVILMLFAIASAADGDGDGDITYTAALSDVKNHIDGRCSGAIKYEDYIALVPQNIWPQNEKGDIGSVNDCIFITIACVEDLDSCKNVADKISIQVVGSVSDDTRGDVEDDGDTVLISKVAFEALADESDSRITISYKPQ